MSSRPATLAIPDLTDAAVDAACSKIAPTWPLDQMIAVNPYWGFVAQPIEQVQAKLAYLSGSPMLMSVSWYQDQWRGGKFTEAHVHKAIAQANSSVSFAQVLSVLHSEAEPFVAQRVRLVLDVVDESRDLSRAMGWGLYVTHSISQFCASYFDQGQAAWVSGTQEGLYPAWRLAAQEDYGPGLLMGVQGVRKVMSTLPSAPRELINAATKELGISSDAQCDYFTALLLSINGWASWCAYLRWQARLQGQGNETLEHLLAIRLAWELVLLRTNNVIFTFAAGGTAVSVNTQIQWLLQSAVEIAFQAHFISGLQSTWGKSVEPQLPKTQAVFCIDVRSEPYRRALEATDPRMTTLGFAGFFGLPMEYTPMGTDVRRAQLPGLLAPRLVAADTCTTDLQAKALGKARRQRLNVQSAWDGWKRASTSAFTFVEALGIGAAAKLVKDSFALGEPRTVDGAGLSPQEAARTKPKLVCHVNGDPVGLAERVELSANILKALSLDRGFARLVLLAGHGSAAASLDCGACCGQSGAVNARVLACLLNDADVRGGLQSCGIKITTDTWFVAGLHNTTTDELSLFDIDDAPESHRSDLAELKKTLQSAGGTARQARAATLGLKGGGIELDRKIGERARDWAQVRPEWGLVNNAAFLVAPRVRSQSSDLQGRVFLHEYRWQEDPGFAVLELIMTAPMIVTHWINMQYYASTVDHRRYGSGNKVLHNVVGTNLGVFEGNGGDLRVGLSWQSVHDGESFRHEPLRLSVFLEAPRPAIDAVMEKHALVKQLVQNQWLHLFAVDAVEQTIHQHRQGQWYATD